jgi:hypothetical protein
MMEYGLSRSAVAAGALLLAACGRPEPEAPTARVRNEICRGKRPVPEPTPAELRAWSYTLEDLGPEFLSNPPPLAKTPAPPSEPVVIPALPPVWNEQAAIPALPPGGSTPNPVSKSEPVLLRNGMDLLIIDRTAPRYAARVPSYCTAGAPLASKVRICASETGNVTAVQILEPSLPVLDRQLPEVIGHWQFRPYVLRGTSSPFCFETVYTVDFQAR